MNKEIVIRSVQYYDSYLKIFLTPDYTNRYIIISRKCKTITRRSPLSKKEK